MTEVDRYKAQLEHTPKDDQTRLALARAYRDREQVELALQQYSVLARARAGDILSAIVSDMESIVASRPDNLEAHELLADLYGKKGELQKALERYRWILKQYEHTSR